VIASYLHIFLAESNRITGLEDNEKQPFLFNLPGRFPLFLKILIFYVTPVLLMAGFSWKSSATNFRDYMYFASMIVTFGMLLLYGKSKLRHHSKPRWYINIIFFMIGMVALAGMHYLSGVLSNNFYRVLNLERAQLSGKKIRYANLWGANLSHADLSNADLSEANLNGANLSRANLSEAILNKTAFIEAVLNKADLSKAYLSETRLDKATLRNVTLSEADLSNAYLREAILIGANLSRAILKEANLTRTNLTEAKLSEAILKKADLYEAILGGAFLNAADLTGANLYNAHLHRANLSGANLDGANLSGAVLSNTNLRGAKGLSVGQICRAKTLHNIDSSNLTLIRQIRSKCPKLLEEPLD
jgi:uncharacterized protein YjbI with pentapeptide repeats